MQGKRIVRYSFFAWLLVLLAACSTTTQQSTNQSSSSQQVSTENIKSTTGSTTSTLSEASTTSSENATVVASSTTESDLPLVNTGAVLKANYTSMAGTWQNASGDELVFDDKGLATEGLTADFLDIDQNGILLLNVQTGTKINETVYIIPANTIFPESYLNGNQDTSDTSKDRLIISEDISSQDLANKVYYHVTN